MLIENKQRLVGIIVLVVFVALLVPFLFSGGSKKEAKEATDKTINNSAIPVTTTTSLNAPQVLEQNAPTINTTTNAAANPPAVSGQAVDTIPVQTINTEMPSNVGVQQPEPIKKSSGSIAQPMPPVVKHSAPSLAPAPAATPTVMAAPVAQSATVATPATPTMGQPAAQPVATMVEQPTTQPVAAVPAQPIAQPAATTVAKQPTTIQYKKAVLKPHALTGTVTGTFWAVQVGSFADQNHVQKLLKDLHAKGFHVTAQKIKTAHGMLTRVVVGHEASRAGAETVAAKLEKTSHLKGTIIKVN